MKSLEIISDQYICIHETGYAIFEIVIESSNHFLIFRNTGYGDNSAELFKIKNKPNFNETDADIKSLTEALEKAKTHIKKLPKKYKGKF